MEYLCAKGFWFSTNPESELCHSAGGSDGKALTSLWHMNDHFCRLWRFFSGLYYWEWAWTDRCLGACTFTILYIVIEVNTSGHTPVADVIKSLKGYGWMSCTSCIDVLYVTVGAPPPTSLVYFLNGEANGALVIDSSILEKNYHQKSDNRV